VVEGQGLVKENADQQNTHRTQCRARVHSALEGVRQIARRDKDVKFTALYHHITIDFLGFCYGFRPGRGQHDALDALVTGIKRKKVSCVLDADVRGFFDAISHGWLVKFIEHRIADKRVLRLIRKWLSAGVVESGTWMECEEGTPQGATISPLLANIYLHYVLDLWIQRWRNRTARGDVIITRFADDCAPRRRGKVWRPAQRGRRRRGLRPGARGARTARAPVHPGHLRACAGPTAGRVLVRRRFVARHDPCWLPMSSGRIASGHAALR
jgi:hypothetical protein